MIRHIIDKTGNCMITCAAMLMETDSQEIIEYLKERLPYPFDPLVDRRGIHIQELMHYAIDHGYVITMVMRDLTLISQSKAGVTTSLHLDGEETFDRYINRFPGILIAGTHAYAWHDGYIYDPNGPEPYQSHYHCLGVHTFLPVIKIPVIKLL